MEQWIFELFVFCVMLVCQICFFLKTKKQMKAGVKRVAEAENVRYNEKNAIWTFCMACMVPLLTWFAAFFSLTKGQGLLSVLSEGEFDGDMALLFDAVFMLCCCVVVCVVFLALHFRLQKAPGAHSEQGNVQQGSEK